MVYSYPPTVSFAGIMGSMTIPGTAGTRERKTSIRRPASGVAIDPERLRRMRERRALNRQQLAEMVIMPNGKPMSRDAIAKIENGARRPKPATLRALCDALGCEPDDLLPEAQ